MRGSATATALVDSAKRSRRLADILDLVSAQGSVTIGGLTTALTASPATIRRDLAVLADRRLLIRTHGGATIAENAAEMPVTLRDLRRREAKRRIGRRAAALIPRERQAIVVGGGTTTAEFARALGSHRGITVVTNSLTIAALAAANPSLKVVVSGGILRPQSLEMVGPIAERTLASMNLAFAVLGADGVSAAGGISTYDETEAGTNNVMIGRARRRIVLADGSKIGATALATICAIDAAHVIVTDSTADPDEVARIRAAGVDVVVVEVPEET